MERPRDRHDLPFGRQKARLWTPGRVARRSSSAAKSGLPSGSMPAMPRSTAWRAGSSARRVGWTTLTSSQTLPRKLTISPRAIAPLSAPSRALMVGWAIGQRSISSSQRLRRARKPAAWPSAIAALCR